MKKYLKYVALLLCLLVVMAIGLIFGSCGPEYYLKRAKINEKKAEILGAVIKADTVFKTVEVKVPGPQTTVTIAGEKEIVNKDTVIYQDKIRIRDLWRHDTLFQFVKCPDTVFSFKTVTQIHRVISATGIAPWWRTTAIVLGIICILLIGLFVLFKKF